MKNLEKALKGKKLEELVSTVNNVEVTLLEPTEAEVGQILNLLKEGKTYREIKLAVRRTVMEGDVQKSAQGFSYGQIKEIDLARQSKIAELTPVAEEL
jgi:hypothetical protein